MHYLVNKENIELDDWVTIAHLEYLSNICF